MAKIVKDTRETIDIDTELENIKRGKKTKEKTKEVKKDAKKVTKKNTKKNSNKKETKAKKKHFKFLGEVKSEMAKVKWPTKKEMVKYSVATIAFVVFFALFFYAIDLIIAVLKEVS